MVLNDQFFFDAELFEVQVLFKLFETLKKNVCWFFLEKISEKIATYFAKTRIRGRASQGFLGKFPKNDQYYPLLGIGAIYGLIWAILGSLGSIGGVLGAMWGPTGATWYSRSIWGLELLKMSEKLCMSGNGIQWVPADKQHVVLLCTAGPTVITT